MFRLRKSVTPSTDSDQSPEAQLRRIAERLEAIEAELGELKQLQRLLPAILRRLYLQDASLPPPFDLTAHRFGLVSQNGEDGLLLALFKRIGVGDRRFVEIGCGVNGGNSGFLALECGWRGLMVDARGAAIDRIRVRYAGYDVLPLRRKVTAEQVNGTLEKFGFTGELDLLSIDIDGMDYWVWKAIDACTPRVVAIEYNYLFGPDVSVTVPYDPEFDLSKAPTRAYRGASLAALAHLGRRKGYRLVATERVNAFFVRDDVAGDLPACEASGIYRGPGNRVKDVLGKLATFGLPLVTVDATGEGAPAVLAADAP